MENRPSLAGMEVPIIGSDSIKWQTLSVPSSSSASVDPTSSSACSRDYGSCSIIGNPPTYFIWRTSTSEPDVLEIMELYGNKDFPRIGLRLVFPDALFPFAVICKNETNFASRTPYMLYAVTCSGVAYLIRLKNIQHYTSSSVFPSSEITEFNTQNNPHCGDVVAVDATAGCLVIGRNDGSVSCFHLGLLDPSAPGFAYELRDDGSFGRLWGIMSRSRTVAAVQDLVVSEMQQKKLLVVLHSDGCLRVWDLLNHSKIFSHTMSAPGFPGATFARLWVGEANNETSIVPLAILLEHGPDASTLMISVFGLSFNFGDKVICSLEPLLQNNSLQGEPVQVKLTSDKVWILTEDGLVMQELFCEDTKKEVAYCYTLEEAYVAEQLFQNNEHSSDDLLWLASTIFSSSKDQIIPFVSSIFLRRFLLPGVYQKAALRMTLQEYNKLITDSEFDCLTVDGVKNEILSLIEHKGGSDGPVMILQRWKEFGTRYFHNWCKNNAACGLLIDSSVSAVGLIRKRTLSLCRCLEDVEIVNFGSFDEASNVISSGLHFNHDSIEREVLFEVLQCISNLSQQLGKASSAVIYEALLSTPDTSEEFVPQLLKILESGYSSSLVARHISEMGADIAWEKELSNHKNLRKFSMDIYLSLHSLRSRATTWDKVLTVIEKYLRFLVPHKILHKSESQAVFSINTSITVHATSQVAKVMFESALDVLMLLSYMIDISGQIYLSHDDVSRVKLELIPMIQEIVTEWHIIQFFGTTPSESPAFEDFSLQLSSLQIDGNINKRSWNDKLGKCEFTLANILLLSIQTSSGNQSPLSSAYLCDGPNIVLSVQEFTSWIIWGSTGEESSGFFSHSIELALVLLRHGQYDAVEYLLTLVDTYSRKEKVSESLQSIGGGWANLLHLLGCCLLAQTQRGLHALLKEKKICEAVRCFFRAASVEGAPQVLQSLPSEPGLPSLGINGCVSTAAWKLHYYQWAMQLFEQYNMSEAACQFALAALEQVDEALGPKDESSGLDSSYNESATAVRGRLWANVFKFTLDLNCYSDAYCAIISNPDEESKTICLRRFIIVLYERNAVKILCDGQLPFVGLSEKVEQELAWKAERSDVSAKPNPFKLLYAFEMHRHNWRKAANYIYLYSAQQKCEAAIKDHQQRSLALQERRNGLSAAINALQLVHPAYAWIEPLIKESSIGQKDYPSKRARMTTQDQSLDDDSQPQRSQSYVDVEKLENEFVLASAEYLLCLANGKWTATGNENSPSEVVDLLVDSNLYDMAFTIVLKFWKGSALKRALGRIFEAMSLKCCPNRLGQLSAENGQRMHGLLLNASQDEIVLHGSHDAGPTTVHSMSSNQWETLELYLDKYKKYHPRLPVIVAEKLLAADPQIELPLWLIQMFKGVRRDSSWGMSGNDSDPASLLRLYIHYGRYTEATTLLLEYIESFASMRPEGVIHRKKPFAVWFPYTTIERLWCQLEESSRLGHKADQSEKLKKLLHGALLNHLHRLKVDSDDVKSSAS